MKRVLKRVKGRGKEMQRQEDTERRARQEESEMGANKSKKNTRETPTETRR